MLYLNNEIRDTVRGVLMRYTGNQLVINFKLVAQTCILWILHL